MKILITGAAGFIGYHAAMRFSKEGYSVVGLDNLNDYYDVNLKLARLKQSGIDLTDHCGEKIIQSVHAPFYRFVKTDILNKVYLMHLFEQEKFDMVLHLAAQAGVRYSLVNPDAYIQSNIVGFFNVLECCRAFPVKHLLYASSSSVYGNTSKAPFVETDMTDDTVSLYAATKKSNELMAFNYSHLFRIPTTGLRFFTVYGPWGRPDMAYYSFAQKIIHGQPIKLFNNGDMYRDFTYVDDIVEGIFRVAVKPPLKNAPEVPKQILNIGHSSPVYMKDFIRLIETYLDEKAIIHSAPMETTDVHLTYADISALHALTGYEPTTTIETGLKDFIEWYRQYNGVKLASLQNYNG